MKIKNISDGVFNLKSGKVEPGETGEANEKECKVLFSSNKAEEVRAAPKPKVVKKNG